jgi:hypothetical protein
MTIEQLTAIVNSHAVWINSVISNSKLPSELTFQELVDGVDSFVVQKGSDDAKRVTSKGLIDSLRLKRYIDGYWVDTYGNSDIDVIEVGNMFEGWSSETRYIVGKVIALPFDADDDLKVSLVIDNEL